MSPGDEGIVITMRLGSELQGRLMGLGLFVGSKVRVLQGGNGKNKPLLLAVGNTRFAIEREIAETIMIEQIASKV